MEPRSARPTRRDNNLDERRRNRRVITVETDHGGRVVVIPEDETTRCADCGEWFHYGATGGTFDGAVARYRCPFCGHWTTGPVPGNWPARSESD